MSLGRNIASRRKSQNFSQEDIATLVGVSRQAVSKWEKDLSSPSTENIIRLAEILRVSVEELTGGRPAAAGRDREDRSVYRVSDSRYLWLLIKDRLFIRLANPVLIFLYLETWQTMYQLAYIGMLKRNLLWLSIYSFGILLFILEGAAAVYIAARRRVILGGEFLELSEEGIVVVDMSYRKKADIHWREVKRVKESRHYYFLILEGRRFLPIPRQDMTEAQESLLKKHARRVRGIKLRIVIAAFWIFVTACGTFAVGRCMVNLNGKLAWKIQEAKTDKKVRLKEKNFYKTGLSGIMDRVQTKVELMPHLMTENVDIIFKKDGEIESIYAFIYGYDMDYKLRTTYLVFYEPQTDKRMLIHTQDWTGVDKSEQKEYDPDNDMEILFQMAENINVQDVVRQWDEERYGFYYKGIASWGYLGAADGIRYIDQKGKVTLPEDYSSVEVKGPSLSIYCPDKKEERTPIRFVYAPSETM